MDSTFLWYGYMGVLILLIIRAWFLRLKLIRYLRGKYPEKALIFEWSAGEWHPWSLASRWLRNLLRNNDIGDPELVQLAKKARRSFRNAFLWFVIAPFIILIIYSFFYKQ